MILHETPSYLDDGAMRNQLEVGRNADLAIMCRNEKTDVIQDFCLWLKAVHNVDNKRCRECSVASLTMCFIGDGNNGSRPQNGTDCPLLTNTTNTTTNAVSTIPPALTNTERELLMKHNGCFRC